MPKSIKGRVIWFDKIVGEGYIEDSKTLEQYYVHYSAIQNKNKKATLRKNRSLKDGQSVEFTLYENSYMKQIKAVKEVAK